jgi:hypothetical protein
LKNSYLLNTVIGHFTHCPPPPPRALCVAKRTSIFFFWGGGGLKFNLNSNYFKMASVRVHFSPGFPLGGGFPTEQNTHVVLCVNRIPPEQNHDSLLPGKFPSLRSSEYRRSNSLRNILHQQALESVLRSRLIFRRLRLRV